MKLLVLVAQGGGEPIVALPVSTYPGLWYQASWGGELGNLIPGEKIHATGDSLNLPVVRQEGAKGFYMISVSED